MAVAGSGDGWSAHYELNIIESWTIHRHGVGQEGHTLFMRQDAERGGWWLRHGLNDEAVRFFSYEAPSTRWYIQCCEVAEWLRELHAYEAGELRPWEPDSR